MPSKVPVGVVVAVLLGGCLGGGPHPSPPLSSSSGFPSNTVPASPIKGPSAQHVTFPLPGDAKFVLVTQPSLNGSILLTYAPHSAGDVATCNSSYISYTRAKIAQFWFMEWNRTGVVLYEEWTFDPSQAFRRTFSMPSADPPFLLWTGNTCAIGHAELYFQASSYVVTDPNFVNATSLAIASNPNEHYNVSIPAGTLDGSLSVPVGPERFLFEYGPTSGDVDPRGGKYGDLYLYEPGKTAGSDAWQKHVTLRPGYSTWDVDHGELPMPGNWTFYVHLLAPWPQDTTWEAKAWTYHFKPANLTAYGFQQPFRLWT